ncbi:uracil-DNA glycosylase family protein [Croceitalea sp. MTPC5]|uniref:uracil-DNA glycosylase family protein n=1 Tax=Croceitalea sp. MTPC5 TaxID=3056565 RepID=UPI0030D519B3
MKACKTIINPKKSSHCRSCGLYINQFPLSDNKKQADIFWVGLSAVQIDDNDEQKIPLSPSTKSGKLIHDVELASNMNISFFKTNLVKCLPLNEKKIRYPERVEMNKCYPNLEIEIDTYKPKIVFLLGRLVAEFTLKKYGLKLGGLGSDFSYKEYKVGETTFVPVHHPSYMLVYKRKHIDKYIAGIQEVISSNLLCEVGLDRAI